jgi:hypothetical protein
MEDARKDAPMSGDNEREPETERSVEVAKVETAGDRAWQTWRAQLADVRAALDQWKVESAASTERWERLRDEAHARAAAAEAEAERLRAAASLAHSPSRTPARTLSRARDGKTPKRDKKEAPALGRGLESREETPKEGNTMDRTF